MSSVVTSRTTPTKEHSTLTPPMTPPDAKGAKAADKSDLPIDIDIPDNYVAWTLKNQKERPPIGWDNWWKELNYLSLAILTITPSIAIWGALNVPLRWQTAVFSVFYYFVTGLGKFHLHDACMFSISLPAGITAGYHRLWAHRAYNASKPLQYFLAIAGAGAVEGSIKWWSRGHRAHHRYTDTALDPYNAHLGFWWSHVGWMLVKPRRRPGVADVSDLSKNEVVRWQHRWYRTLILTCGFILPTLVCGFGWGDFMGGYVFAGAARLCFVHHVRIPVDICAWLVTEQAYSLLSASTRSLTGSARLPSMTSTLLATT